MAKPIALAADHGGFELKEAVKAHLEELGLEYIDYGTHSTAQPRESALRLRCGRPVRPGLRAVQRADLRLRHP